MANNFPSAGALLLADPDGGEFGFLYFYALCLAQENLGIVGGIFHQLYEPELFILRKQMFQPVDGDIAAISGLGCHTVGVVAGRIAVVPVSGVFQHLVLPAVPVADVAAGRHGNLFFRAVFIAQDILADNIMTFVIGSGLLHWFYIVSGELLEPVFKKMRTALHIKAEQKLFICFQQFRTFLLVTLGFVFFRSPSVADAFQYLGRGLRGYSLSFFTKGELFGLGLDWIELGVAVVSLIIFFAVTNLTQKGSMYEWLEKRPVLVRRAILYALLFYVILLGKYGPDFSASEFIYQNFKV